MRPAHQWLFLRVQRKMMVAISLSQCILHANFPTYQQRRAHTLNGTSAAAQKLNAFSTELRHILAGTQRIEGGHVKSKERERAIFAALVAHPVTESGAAEGGGDVSPSRSPLLHPLLCLRILERLGYPLLSPSSRHRASENGEERSDEVEQKGWLVRLRQMGATEDEIRRVFEHVLLPLQPLLGSAPSHQSEQGSSMHPQLKPLLPLALAWWCQYSPPTNQIRQSGAARAREAELLPATVWLPHLIHFYSKAEATSSPASTPLPLPFLLPFLFHKVHGQQGEPLSALLTLCLRERALEEAARAQGGAVAVSSPALLVEALFWSTQVPLLSFPTVQEALRNAGPVAGSPSLSLRVGIDSDDTFRRFLLRMTALMQHQRKHATVTNMPLLLVEPFLTPDPGCVERDEDNILRWINPFHDFLSTLYASATPEQLAARAEGAQLSFTGVLNILSAILDRLQALRSTSSCNRAGKTRNEATGTTVTPFTSDEPQRFALLPHKPRVHTVKRTCEILLHHTRRVLAKTETDGTPQQTWFNDVPVAQQEAVLRRVCGVSRALVRVAMEEKRVSLLTEGPEGTALTAGGASSSGRGPEKPDSFGSREQSGPSSSSLMAVSLALRNTAFRVLEPALWRFYCADTEVASSALLSSLPSLSMLLRLHPFDLLANEGARSHVEQQHPDIFLWLSDAFNTVALVSRDVGGEAAWETASQLLQHPMQQPAVAVLEGVRLLALHELLFSPARRERRESVKETVERLELSVQSVWNTCSEATAAASGKKDSAEAASSAIEATQRLAPLQERLALLSLLVLARVGATEAAQTEAARDAVRRACGSLFQALTGNGAFGTEWSAVGLEALLPPTTGEGKATDAIFFGPCDATAAVGRPSCWELREELRELCGPSSCSPAASSPPAWEWLGSPAAVLRAATTTASASSQEGAEQQETVRHYLIPWSTLAESRHPLRLYDESGQSAGEAVAFFDHHLQVLLSHARPDGFRATPVAVIRFVSVLEELELFADVASRLPEVRLGDDIVIKNDELRLALELSAWVTQGHAQGRHSHEEDEDGEYDGLD